MGNAPVRIVTIQCLDASHNKSANRTMVTQLIEHERIRTTLPKAKELRRVADQVVTLAKEATESSRRRAQGILRTPLAMEKLFKQLGPRYELRAGGYTRVLKADFRRGDGAEMAVIEYIDRPGEIRRSKPPAQRVAIGKEEASIGSN
uniref:50S ribosomal protein L17 putative n=1 Tax=Albugo laibachii Nc14 TaxID=890382 RepID=F0WFZ5_9STRA|nr:50S ribosomal protein L17 putative [Albugo laibachii Nc14]|eukprot:CCA20129.1 50S ribosomal protein L17 putative [Albugo laibachii Nc14]